MNKHIPSKSSSPRRRLPWITPSINRQCRKRERLHKKAKRKGTPKAWDAYQHQRNHVQKLEHTAHDNYISNIIGQSLLEGDSKRFYSYLRLKCTENINIPVLSTAGQHHVTDTSKAEALSQQFLSTFTQEDTDNMPSISHQQFNSIQEIIFTQNGITKLLQQIRPGKAAGPDELPARVLKEMACEISGMLTFLFQQSYECGSVPEDWSKATVAAIYIQEGEQDGTQ